MAKVLKRMNVTELVNKILILEKDFTGIELEYGSNLNACERYEELQRYLAHQNMEDAPIDFSGSTLKYLQAEGLYLPFIKGIKTDFSNANLIRAHFESADFKEANLSFAYLSETDFTRTNLFSANLSHAVLDYANFYGADLSSANFNHAVLIHTNLFDVNLNLTTFWCANLSKASLISTKNLRTALYLKYALLHEVKLGMHELEIIREALRSKPD